MALEPRVEQDEVPELAELNSIVFKTLYRPYRAALPLKYHQPCLCGDVTIHTFTPARNMQLLSDSLLSTYIQSPTKSGFLMPQELHVPVCFSPSLLSTLAWNSHLGHWD